MLIGQLKKLKQQLEDERESRLRFKMATTAEKEKEKSEEISRIRKKVAIQEQRRARDAAMKEDNARKRGQRDAQVLSSRNIFVL